MKHNANCLVKYETEHLEHFFDNKSNERIQKLMVRCTNSDQDCDWIGELKDLDDHRSRCPKEEIPCTFSEVGCEIRPLRENLDDHITQDQQLHLHCAMTSVLQLRQELATAQENLKETLTECMDEVRILPMILKMSDYASFHKTRNTWYSTPFYSRRIECRLRLCIRLQTEGYCFPEKANVAVELLYSQTRPIPCIPNSLTVELLNQARDAAHHKITLTSTSLSKMCEEGIVAFGCFDAPEPTFLGYNNQVQYLLRDCLFFRVSEDEGVRKPWLVDPMPRSDWKQLQPTRYIM